MLHPMLMQTATQAQHVGAHLVLLILACIFFAFAAFAPWWVPADPSPYYNRFNAIGLGLFCWSLSWFF
jgi:hypothetical protein